MAVHGNPSVKLTHLKACSGCRKACKWTSLVSIDGGIEGVKYPCNGSGEAGK